MVRARKKRLAGVAEIAREAGVGTATVDRVLHARGGVSRSTIERVNAAFARIVESRKTAGASRSTRYRLDVILPSDAGPSTERLRRALISSGRRKDVEVVSHSVEKMNAGALAQKLGQLDRNDNHAVAFQALEHPLVHDAVASLAASGKPLITLMSDLGGGPRYFVGTDNRAAGRTAGLLMGRFSHGPGKVAVIWGGELYRSHEEREIGFRSVMRAEFPELELFDIVSGRDDDAGNYDYLNRTLARDPTILGVYSVGGGNGGIIKAVRENRRAHDITVVAHNLDLATKAALIDGTIDAVIHQNMDLAAGIVISTFFGILSGRTTDVRRLPVEIVTKENILDPVGY